MQLNSAFHQFNANPYPNTSSSMQTVPICESSAATVKYECRRAGRRLQQNDDDDDGDAAYFNSMPPGYRFYPSDEELVVDYLAKKINNGELPRNMIHEVRLYEHDPDYFAERYRPTGQNKWYFFTSRDRKYKNGSRPKRDAGNGFWKATGADKIVMLNGEEVGYRKSLLFYRGRPTGSGVKTSWMMNEYRVKNPPAPTQTGDDRRKLDDCVLCKIYRKANRNREAAAVNNVDGDHMEAEVQNRSPSTVALGQAQPQPAEAIDLTNHTQAQHMNADYPSAMKFFSPGETWSSGGFQDGLPSTPFNQPPPDPFNTPHPMYLEPPNIPIQWNQFACMHGSSSGPQYALSETPTRIQEEIHSTSQIPAGPISMCSQEADLTPAPVLSRQDDEFAGISALEINERYDLGYLMEVWSQTPHEHFPAPDLSLPFWWNL